MEFKEMTLSLISIIVCCIALVKGDTHCHCNSPNCVATGYMCRSIIGQCFSFYSTNGAQTISSHGCAEELPTENEALNCLDTLDTPVRDSKNISISQPILICCREDMCNHLLDEDSRIRDSHAQKDGRAIETQFNVPENYENYRSERELWFKAAVIAVPIAGGFILLLLVLLAVRMLRHDKKRHNRILELRAHRGLAKAQIYVADHFLDKKRQKKSAQTLYAQNLSAYSDVKLNLDSYGKLENAPTTSSPRKLETVAIWNPKSLKTVDV